jgi:hypothetical protein
MVLNIKIYLLPTALEAGGHKADAMLILFQDRLFNVKIRQSACYQSSKASGERTADL